MKNKSLITAMALVCATALGQPGQMTAAAKRTVKDYFYLLPTAALLDPLNTKEQRKLFLTTGSQFPGDEINVTKVIDDARNGYLEVQYGSFLGPESLALAIWRGDNGSDIVGVSRTSGAPAFYSYENGQWRDVTKEVFGSFTKALFAPKQKWPARCGSEENSSSPKEMEFPRGFMCPVPRKGLDITCSFKVDCWVHGSVSVFQTQATQKPEAYYGKRKVRFLWKKNRFEPQ